MPELPEVETVKNALQDRLVGQTITQVQILLPKVVKNQLVPDFVTAVTGQTIRALTRRGKYLTIRFVSGAFLVVHFRMTGVLTLEPRGVPWLKHTHLVLTLGHDWQLRYSDLRAFGGFWFFGAGDQDTSGQQKLGPEPTAVTAAYLQAKFAKRHRAIKTVLLDQTVVAGIGNIYSDEICFRTGVRPMTPADQLPPAVVQKLVTQIPAVITEFIGVHHVSFADYAQSQGTSYQTDTNLQVYGRAQKPCCLCHTTLVGTRIDGRSSVYCPHCQKEC